MKFIRFAEHYDREERRGRPGVHHQPRLSGQPTFRGMRWHLLKSLTGYVLDLHGNAKKKK
ncbi:MAG: hypothetical protein U5O69_09115 [Candidatus Competibacteraceae bacterium]|nr:hypothetical protein [Candidatus Competibacteraceae bacterium]